MMSIFMSPSGSIIFELIMSTGNRKQFSPSSLSLLIRLYRITNLMQHSRKNAAPAWPLSFFKRVQGRTVDKSGVPYKTITMYSHKEYHLWPRLSGWP